MTVENALRRFSEDRTGMPDFALESGGQNHQQSLILYTDHLKNRASIAFSIMLTSVWSACGLFSVRTVCARPAGGSILSTRCSETYRTKVALLSLFGFPLWYFSQSPRAVIQVKF